MLEELDGCDESEEAKQFITHLRAFLFHNDLSAIVPYIDRMADEEGTAAHFLYWTVFSEFCTRGELNKAYSIFSIISERRMPLFVAFIKSFALKCSSQEDLDNLYSICAALGDRLLSPIVVPIMDRLIALRHYDGIEAYFQLLVSHGVPLSTQIYSRYAMALFTLGRFSEVAELCERALAAQAAFDQTLWMYWLGCSFDGIGRTYKVIWALMEESQYEPDLQFYHIVLNRTKRAPDAEPLLFVLERLETSKIMKTSVTHSILMEKYLERGLINEAVDLWANLCSSRQLTRRILVMLINGLNQLNVVAHTDTAQSKIDQLDAATNSTENDVSDSHLAENM